MEDESKNNKLEAKAIRSTQRGARWNAINKKMGIVCLCSSFFAHQNAVVFYYCSKVSTQLRIAISSRHQVMLLIASKDANGCKIIPYCGTYSEHQLASTILSKNYRTTERH